MVPFVIGAVAVGLETNPFWSDDARVMLISGRREAMPRPSILRPIA
jgi:hypothetical protein